MVTEVKFWTTKPNLERRCHHLDQLGRTTGSVAALSAIVCPDLCSEELELFVWKDVGFFIGWLPLALWLPKVCGKNKTQEAFHIMTVVVPE